MKSYFLRNVVNQIIKRKVETFIMLSIVLVMSLFLSLIHFFGYSDSMESNIANSLSLRYEIKNTHYLSPNSSIINENKSYQKLISWIEKVEKDQDVKYADYNIQLNLFSNYDLETGRVHAYRLYGVSSENYLIDNTIELIEGRFFTQEEIDSGKNYIIVCEDTKAYINGEYSPIKLNDKIIVGKTNDIEGGIYKELEFEVIGIYKYKELSSYYKQNDDFINSHGCIVSNKVLNNYISLKNETENYTDYSINHICFYLNDYENYLDFQMKLNSYIKEFSDELFNLYELDSGLSINETNTGSIIQSVSRIKNIYKIIFIVVFMITSFILIFSIYYFIKKKTKEISIYYSLGQSKVKIIFHYCLTYILIGIIALFFGILLGYFLSNQLSQMMLIENVELQNQLLKFTSTTINSNSVNANIKSLSFELSSVILVVSEIIGLISISTFISMIFTLNKEILSRNGG